MAEIKVKDNESLDSAMKRFKNNAPELELSPKLEKELLTKSPRLNARKSLKQLEVVNINIEER